MNLKVMKPLVSFKIDKNALKQIANICFEEIIFKCQNNDVRFVEYRTDKISQGILNAEEYSIHDDLAITDENAITRYFGIRNEPIKNFADRCFGDTILVEFSERKIKLTDSANPKRIGDYRLKEIEEDKLSKAEMSTYENVSLLLYKKEILYNQFMLEEQDYISLEALDRPYSKAKGTADHIRWKFLIDNPDVELLETRYTEEGDIDQDIWTYQTIEQKKSGKVEHPVEFEINFNDNIINNYVLKSGTQKINLLVGSTDQVITTFSTTNDHFQSITLVKPVDFPEINT